MALADDLMGLGLPPAVALSVATGGNGDLTIAAAGSAYSTGTAVLAGQKLVSVSGADGNKGVSLPAVGANVQLGDQYIIGNTANAVLKAFAPSGVSITCGGTNTSTAAIPAYATLIVYPVSSTQWIGIVGT